MAAAAPRSICRPRLGSAELTKRAPSAGIASAHSRSAEAAETMTSRTPSISRTCATHATVADKSRQTGRITEIIRGPISLLMLLSLTPCTSAAGVKPDWYIGKHRLLTPACEHTYQPRGEFSKVGGRGSSGASLVKMKTPLLIPLWPRQRALAARLFADHFQDDENDQGQAEAAAEKPNQKSRTGGSNDGVHEFEDEWSNHARWIAWAAGVDVSLTQAIGRATSHPSGKAWQP